MESPFKTSPHPIDSIGNWMIRVAHFILLLFLFPLPLLDAQSQNQVFKHITIEDGLLSDRVYAIYQDSNGFMWLANHNKGVLKYDGYKFTHYDDLQSRYRKSLITE